MKKIIYRLKNRVQDFKINFKKKFKEYKEKPKSKRKSFMIGFATAVGIFSLILFVPALSAVAKDLPKETPKPTEIALPPAPVAEPTQVMINKSLSGLAASVCGAAVSSGSFGFGIACGFIVVIGILQGQRK